MNASDKSQQVVDSLAHSKLYQEYERAFARATGLPVVFRPLDTWQVALHNRPNESPFCRMMAEQSRSCASCLQLQQQLNEQVTDEPVTLTCEMGLCDTAVPVRLGDRPIGVLQTGQVFRKKPTEAQFKKVKKLFEKWELKVDEAALRDAFFGTRVVSPKQYDATVRLLNMFAKHLSLVSNQLLLQQENAEPAMIRRAKDYIREHQSEDLSLGQVAKAVNVSVFYFCKMFKKYTGLNFTEYLSRVRLERARNLLLNPNLRISEIAFDVGFQSLTHFNRVFKKLMGQSPTVYRRKLKLAA